MSHYRCSDGSKVSKAAIDANVRKAKALKIQQHLDEHGYLFCTECFRNDCKPIDCSHVISVDECQKTGQSELAWDLNNITILGRKCHQKRDKLYLSVV